MKKRIVLVITTLVLSLLIMVVTSSAQERTIGVTEGDWFKYGYYSGNWSSTDPNATISPNDRKWLVGMNGTEWKLISIVSTLHTNIYYQIRTRSKNGTEEIEGAFLDISTGTSNTSRLMMISSNLEVNDSIYAWGPFSAWRINQTIDRAYLDSVRGTNYVNITRETLLVNNETIVIGTIRSASNYSWDKSSGILVDYSFQEITQVGDYQTTLSTSFSLIESNVWIVPEFPTSMMILIMLIVATVIITLSKRRYYKTIFTEQL